MFNSFLLIKVSAFTLTSHISHCLVPVTFPLYGEVQEAGTEGTEEICNRIMAAPYKWRCPEELSSKGERKMKMEGISVNGCIGNTSSMKLTGN